MTTLPNFPLISQQTTVTGDGQPSENYELDCVAASICAGCMYLNGVKSLGGKYTPDSFKDAAYGQGYKGTTSAQDYVAYCALLGIKLVHFDGQPNSLVQELHQQIHAGHPCIVTVPDIYVPASYGWTHVLCMYGEASGQLTALDPWPGKPTTKSDAEWAQLLQFNQIWILEKEGSMSGVPQGWRDSNNVLYSPSHVQGGPEVPITGPFRDYVLANAWRPSDRAIEHGHHVVQLEYSNLSLGSGWTQQFLYSRLEKPDSGALAGRVLYGWSGVEANYLRAGFEAQLAEIATLKQEIAAHQPGLDATKVQERLAALGKVFQEGGDLAAQPL